MHDACTFQFYSKWCWEKNNAKQNPSEKKTPPCFKQTTELTANIPSYTPPSCETPLQDHHSKGDLAKIPRQLESQKVPGRWPIGLSPPPFIMFSTVLWFFFKRDWSAKRSRIKYIYIYKRHPGTKSFKVEPMDVWWKYSLHLSEFPVEIEDSATKISFTLNCFRKIVPLITVGRFQQLFDQKPEVKCGRPTKVATSSFCRKMTRFSALSKLGMKRSRLSARRGRV